MMPSIKDIYNVIINCQKFLGIFLKNKIMYAVINMIVFERDYRLPQRDG